MSVPEGRWTLALIWSAIHATERLAACLDFWEMQNRTTQRIGLYSKAMVKTPQGAEMDDLTSWSLRKMVDAFRAKNVSARELLEAHLSRFETYHSVLNAIVVSDVEGARQLADQADKAWAQGEDWGPLHGIPMTVKEAFDVKGMKTTIGLPWLRNNVASQDAVLVRQLKQAGANIWGKTNLPTSSYDWQTNNLVYGRTCNPWDPTCTPGGSSGGAAAAVAAGLTPVGIGSDVAGSIRGPSHFCGVYGLRPSFGLLSSKGHANMPGGCHAMRHFVSVGPHARHVEDIDFLMREVLLDPRRDTSQFAMGLGKQRPLSTLKIAYTMDIGYPLSLDTKDVCLQVVETLRKAGAEVIEASPSYSFEEAFQCWGDVHGFELKQLAPWIGRGWMGGLLMRFAILRWMFGASTYAKYVGRGTTNNRFRYFLAQHTLDGILEQLDSFFDTYDLWLMPVAGRTAFPHCRTGASLEVDGQKVPYSDVTGVWNCVTSLTGHAALAIPCGMGRDGLPIGLQLQAPRFHDLFLLHAAKELEALLTPVGMPALEKTMG